MSAERGHDGRGTGFVVRRMSDGSRALGAPLLPPARGGVSAAFGTNPRAFRNQPGPCLMERITCLVHAHLSCTAFYTAHRARP